MEGVTAEAILAWQGEARLLCAMPHLRPFDARVLSGAGVRDQRQLAEMHPGRLLERVERFLATERGRQIMRSGSAHELSRITAWIASAQRGAPRPPAADIDAAPAFGIDPTSPAVRARRGSNQREHSAHAATPTYHIVQRDDAEFPPGARRENGQETAASSARPDRRRPRRERPRRPADEAQTARAGNNSVAAQHFHLELNSPVVDAPAIGAAMTNHLDRVGIATVGDLLAMNADKLASELALPRVTGATVRAWQEQSRLVCRIPNLRGHDAQILVACGIKTPESLSQMDASALLAQVTAFANSAQGQRVLRGSQVPDIIEVTDWIEWAAHSRTLRAA
jgi:hypothetical protein